MSAGVNVSVGLSGAGKTYGIQQSVFEHTRRGHPSIVIDRMYEWDSIPQDIASNTMGCHSVSDAIAALEPGPDNPEPARLAIVRVRSHSVPDAVDEAAEWAISHDGLAGLAIPEAHNVMPSRGKLSEPLEDIVTAWRHHKVALWCDSQRTALLSTHVIELAYELRLYAQHGENNLNVVRGIGGRELLEAVSECTTRLGPYDERTSSYEDPGWHVQLRAVRTPPFVPVKC